MYDRIREQRPLRTGLQRAALHFLKAGYEVVSGLAAFVEEVVDAVTDSDPEDDAEGGPHRIEVE